ncbi:MAG TPA: LysM domain-containing protein [Myxococcota bacterium]|nr:LysM domain-containing protein [Myxococcota bacterium]
MNRITLALVASFAFLLPGCRDMRGSDGQRCGGPLGMCPAVLPAPVDPLAPADPGDSVSMIMKELKKGPQNDYIISLQPEDTLNLLAEWSGQTVEELLARNPLVKQTGLIPGNGFTIRLSAGAWNTFNGARNGFRARLLEKRSRGLEVLDVVRHRVKAGDTMESIARDYGTMIDLVEKFNPKARGLSLYPGDEIMVPIVAGDEAREATGRKSKTERLPGPPAPNPTPVPVPPSESRQLLVDSPGTIR